MSTADILLIILIILLLGGGGWGYRNDWGTGPIGIIGFILVIILILFFARRL